jgi:hypothetical protein
MQQGILVAERERDTHAYTQRREGYGKLQKRHRVESKRVVRMVGGSVRVRQRSRERATKYTSTPHRATVVGQRAATLSNGIPVQNCQ